MPESITDAAGNELALPTDAASPAPGPAPTEPLPPRDQDAPYGRKADGTPRQPPGPKPRPRAAGTAPSEAIPAPALPMTDARKSLWRAGLGGFGQAAAGLAVVAHKRSDPPNDAWLADAAAISMATPQLADATIAVAEQDPRMARVLDKICAVGPYGALITAAVGLGAQLAANHGRIPAGAMGTLTRTELLGEKPAGDALPDAA